MTRAEIWGDYIASVALIVAVGGVSALILHVIMLPGVVK